MNDQVWVWLALGCLAAVPLVAAKLRLLDVIPRSRWLSLAGGISVAYAFVHLLPELREHQEVLQEAAAGPLAFLEHHAYLVALARLATFYGLERAAIQSRRARQKTINEDVTSRRMFWLSTTSFTLYNALVGYLLMQREHAGALEVALFTLAMALHVFVNDYGLHQHHKQYYARTGRWIISAGVPAGGIAGMAALVPPSLLALVVAFLTGGIILNVLKEELPEERESRFVPFLLGTAGYAILLLFI